MTNDTRHGNVTSMSPRRFWQLFEPVHAVTYFRPEATAPLKTLGVEGFWPRYIMQRAAPLGPVGPAVVTAAFFNFHPRRADAVLPHGWAIVNPAATVKAREEGVLAVLRPLAEGLPMEELADLLWAVAQHACCHGRVLAAANQSLPRPEDSLAQLWQACTTLREHRGDGHVAALVAHGVTGLQAMQLKVAAGMSEARSLRLGRGWSEQEWEQAGADLRALGWVDAAGRLTDIGEATQEEVEAATDKAAAQPWQALTGVQLSRVAELLRPLAVAAWGAGEIPAVNAIALPRLQQSWDGRAARDDLP